MDKRIRRTRSLVPASRSESVILSIGYSPVFQADFTIGCCGDVWIMRNDNDRGAELAADLVK